MKTFKEQFLARVQILGNDGNIVVTSLRSGKDHVVNGSFPSFAKEGSSVLVECTTCPEDNATTIDVFDAQSVPSGEIYVSAGSDPKLMVRLIDGSSEVFSASKHGPLLAGITFVPAVVANSQAKTSGDTTLRAVS